MVAVAVDFNFAISYCLCVQPAGVVVAGRQTKQLMPRRHCVQSPWEWQLISGRHNCCLSGLGTLRTDLGAVERPNGLRTCSYASHLRCQWDQTWRTVASPST